MLRFSCISLYSQSSSCFNVVAVGDLSHCVTHAYTVYAFVNGLQRLMLAIFIPKINDRKECVTHDLMTSVEKQIN